MSYKLDEEAPIGTDATKIGGLIQDNDSKNQKCDIQNNEEDYKSPTQIKTLGADMHSSHVINPRTSKGTDSNIERISTNIAIDPNNIVEEEELRFSDEGKITELGISPSGTQGGNKLYDLMYKVENVAQNAHPSLVGNPSPCSPNQKPTSASITGSTTTGNPTGNAAAPAMNAQGLCAPNLNQYPPSQSNVYVHPTSLYPTWKRFASRVTATTNSNEKYPLDSYSFIALNGHQKGQPWNLKRFKFFLFGLLPCGFQMLFLGLLLYSQMNELRGTIGEVDNPDQDIPGVFFATFLPANATEIVRVAQVTAMTAYLIFPDSSLQDIVRAVQLFPQGRSDGVGYLRLSCVLRLIQGTFAMVVTLLLVLTSETVVDIILNFTAVNFISGLDDDAFTLAITGEFSPGLKVEAERIAGTDLPPCAFNKEESKWKCFKWVTGCVYLVVFGMITFVYLSQNSDSAWVTGLLRVQFQDSTGLNEYSGCFGINTDSSSVKFSRRTYHSLDTGILNTSFGYCREDRQWILFRGNTTDPCDARADAQLLLARSSQTDSFDISTSFDGSWVSASNTPLDLYFFDDNKNELDDEECASFLADGKCDRVFNIFDHNFDEGDCCAATCEGLTCGQGSLTIAFNNNVTSGNGYPSCRNPSMKNITIKLDNVYGPNLDLGDTPTPFDGVAPRDPLMILECDGTNVLMVYIQSDMKFETETVQVADGANCHMTVKNTTGGPLDIQYVNYTVYHGDSDSIETNPIVMFRADSSIEGEHSFRRIPECYFDKLSDYVDVPTIYTGDGPSNKAIEWLMEDSEGYSNCEYDSFVERYALATINFAAPRIDESEDGDSTELWISEHLHCVWKNVACIDEWVVELDLGSASGIFLSGTIATEIGLLKNLNWLELGVNDIYGTIPTEIGEWKNLNYFSVDSANLSGPIPSELAKLTNFEWLILNDNQLTGNIPTEIGQMTSMRAFVVGNNKLVGTIPNEIGEVSLLEYFFVGNNTITGPIPTELGLLPDLLYISTFMNEMTGNIPSEIAKITALQYIQLADNDLTGSIPIELFNRSYVDFDFFGNPLSDLIPIEGQEICDAGEGEIYCNCGSDCTFRPYHCECDAAKSCCDTFLAQYTQCEPCPTEGLLNPDTYVEAYLATCRLIASYVENSLVEFGTPETCYGGKLFLNIIGCFCKSPDDAVEMPEGE